MSIVNTPASSAPVESIEVDENVEETPVENEEVAEVSAQTGKTEAKKTAEIKKELKKLKIKFNGKEEDVEFDPTDDEYLTKQFQLAKLGQTKSHDYSKLEKEVDQFINLLKTNPRAILSDPTIGIDLKKFASEIIDEEIQNSAKSPEQKERERLEGELKALKDEQKRKDEEFKTKEFERMQQSALQQYDNQIHEALQASNVPKNAYTIKKIADYMLLGLQNGMDVTAADVLPLVQQEIQSDIKELFGVMPDEVLEQLIGKDVIGRLRKKSIAKAKATPVPVKKTPDVSKFARKPAPAPQQKKTIRELLGV